MPLLDPLAAFVAAYAVLVAASLRGAKAYVSILLMIAVYAVLASAPGEALEAAQRLTEWNDVRVFVYIFLSLMVAGIMKERGLLDRMVRATSAAGCRFSLLSVPALIGLIPMPGGALVSAIALKRKFFEEARLGREEATYVNYWFRHLWVPSWPLFQSVVITAAVFGLDPLGIVSHTWPGTVAALAGGLLVAWPLLRGVRCASATRRGAARLFLASTWPLLLLAALFLASRSGASRVLSLALPGYAREPMLASLALVVALLLVVYRPARGELAGALRLASKPTIHLVLLESLYFKNLIIATGAAASVARLVEWGGVPLWLVVLVVPFVLGLAAGGENFFASTAMPLLTPYILSAAGVDWFLLSLAYLGGYLGVMASPVHLCLVLTAEYYGSRLGGALRYVLASVAASIIVGGVLVWALWG